MRPRFRFASGLLVYVLTTTLLLGQQRSLTTPLTSSLPASPVRRTSALVSASASTTLVSSGASSASPSAKSSASASSSETTASDSPPARVARNEGPSGAAAPSVATALEADYFSGVASSSYPISVPRGRGGMTPALSLDYRSAAGNSWVGVGWDLHPGAIERQTKDGVDYLTENYVYRTSHASETLVTTGPNLFATEIASRFEKFEKRTGANGPYWVVTDTRGTVREYGATAQSRLANPADAAQVFAWRLERVVDTLGNTTLLEYQADGGNLYLRTIRYTVTGNLPADNAVTFDTEPRADVERSFETGFEVKTNRRLSRIRVQTAGHVMPALALDYGTAASEATGRSLLRRIAIVSTDGSTRLPPTQYRYQGGRVAVTTAVSVGGPAVTGEVGDRCLTGDFNGDTYTDIACYKGNGSWDLTLSSATGWTTSPILGPAPGDSATRQCTTGDLNADGRTDLLCYTTVGGKWHRVLGSPTGWDSSGELQGSVVGVPYYNNCFTGDINGDGRTDLGCWMGGTNWELTISQGNVWAPPVKVTNGPVAGNVGSRCVAADFNGDAKTDLTCYTGVINASNQGLWYIGTSTGSGWKEGIKPGPRPDVNLGNRCLFSDFNGDRRTDMLCYSGSERPGTKWILSLATANGFDATKEFVGPNVYTPIAENCAALDFNGDGRADVACYAFNGQFRTFISSGDTFLDQGNLTGPTLTGTIPKRCVLGDFNGDGKGDMACRGGTDWQVMLPGGATPDLMSGTTNIFGGVTSLEYSRAATMANTRIPFPLDVVTKSIAEDGTGRKAATSIVYVGGYFDVPTRDFRGFRNARITGPTTDGAGGTAVIRYHQGSSTEFGADDPAAAGGYMRGRPDRTRILDSQGNVLRETSFFYGSSNAVSRFHPVTETTTRACENNVCNEETRVVNTYDRFGNIVRVEDYGDITRLEDDLTRITTYAYNEQKYIVSLPATEEVLTGVPSGRRLSFTKNYFDGTDTCKTAATATVPARGLVTRISRWVTEGQPLVEERAAFDDAGNVVCRADPLGNETSFTFDSSKTFLQSTQNALAHRTTFTYHGVGGQSVDRGLYGLARTVTDPNGAVSTTEWDGFGRKTRVIAPLGSITSWTYTNLGVPLQQNIRTTNTGLTTTVYLDGFGRSVKSRRSGPEQKFIVSGTRYNDRGLPVGASFPAFEGETPVGEATVVYDTLRRPVEERDAAGNRRTICYSSGATDLIDENGHRTRRVVSATGRLLQVERYSGVYTRDCAVLPLHGTGVVQPYSITQYREDALGRLTRIIDTKGVVTTVEYDGLGRRTRLTDPAVGERSFTFNAAGDETSWLSAAGAAMFVKYDALHRPIQKDYFTPKPAGSGDVINVYDEAGRNGIGRLTSTRNASAMRAITYDREGRVTLLERTLGGKVYREQRTYDTLGRTLEVVYPDGKRITQSYDGPAVRSVYSASVTYALFSNYNAAGFAQQVRYGNGTVSTSTYETPSNPECPRATYRLCSTKTLGANNAVIFQATYGYDPKGNVTVAREPSVVRSYIYDEFDRLRGAASSRTGVVATEQYRASIAAAQFPRDWAMLSAPSAQLQLDEGFAYDPSDDIAWKWDVGTYEYPQATAATMNPHAPRKVGNDTLVWDGDGNMFSGFGRTSSYNLDGRVVSIDLPRKKQRAVGHAAGGNPRSYQYEYDTDGSRVRESGPNGITAYAGDLTECRFGAQCVNHIYAATGRVATESADGKVVYFHRDHQRSVRAVTDGTGAVSARYAYSSYGAPGGSGTLPSFLSTSVLFGSQPYAADAGVYTFGGRAYDPRFGRFLSPDDVIPVAGSPQYLNRYIYAHANPVSTIDPDGHIVWLLAGMVLGAILGAVNAHLQHMDWRRGALLGAISGAAIGLPMEFSNLAVQSVVSVVSGAASGGLTAAIKGGDIGQGILAGGAKALLGQLQPGSGATSSFWKGFDGAFGTTVEQMANSAFMGAVYGGLKAVEGEGDFLSGAVDGAKAGVVGAVTRAVGGQVAEFLGVNGPNNPFGAVDTAKLSDLFTKVAKANLDGAALANLSLDRFRGGGSGDQNRSDSMKHASWQDPAQGRASATTHALSLSLGSLERPSQSNGPSNRYGYLENYVMGTDTYGQR
jgi:RHS repeat-associated protein